MMSDLSLQERLSNDMKQAMKDRETELRDTIRFMLSVVKNAGIDKRAPLTRDDEIALLRTQAKQRQDSIEQFRAGGRDDLADREAAQLAILEQYLPEQMSDDELDVMVRTAIEETGASNPKDMGKVMGILTRRSEGRVDGKRLSTVVREALAGK